MTKALSFGHHNAGKTMLMTGPNYMFWPPARYHILFTRIRFEWLTGVQSSAERAGELRGHDPTPLGG